MHLRPHLTPDCLEVWLVGDPTDGTAESPALVRSVQSRLGHPWQIEASGSRVEARVRIADSIIALAVIEQSNGALGVRFWVGGWADYRVSGAGQVLGVFMDIATSVGAETVTVATDEPLLRHLARRGGFKGPLRGPLTFHLSDLSNRARETKPFSPSDLAVKVAEPVPGITVVAKTAKSSLSRLYQSALSGVGPMIRLEVANPAEGSLRVSVPNRADVMPEPVAMTIDTSFAIKARFGDYVAQVHEVSFDYADPGMSNGRIAGTAHQVTSMVHLSADYCCCELSKRVVPLDRVVAHEFGHHIYGLFESRRYKDSIEMRRALGSELGVASLELAIKGNQKDASAEAALARERFAREVSAYATTNLSEAMAELFAFWWERGNGATGIVAVFGELVDRYINR